VRRQREDHGERVEEWHRRAKRMRSGLTPVKEGE